MKFIGTFDSTVCRPLETIVIFGVKNAVISAPIIVIMLITLFKIFKFFEVEGVKYKYNYKTQLKS